MNDKNLEEITRAVMQAVGQRLHGSDPDVMEVVVREVASAMSGIAAVPPPSTPSPSRPAQAPAEIPLPVAPAPASRGTRAVVTTTGPNKKGVLGVMATQIAEAGGDIQDVSQTIISDFFTMIMLVDTAGLNIPFSTFKEQLVTTSEQYGIHTVVMHEKVLQAMQRV